jgi:hypothetical protein
MESSHLRSRIETRTRVKFPWLLKSQNREAISSAKKNSCACVVSSKLSPTSDRSLGKPAIPHAKPQPPIDPQELAIHPLDKFLHDLRLKKEANSRDDEGAPSGPACNSVLVTVELLENILSSLPVRNLFVVQAVSKIGDRPLLNRPASK